MRIFESRDQTLGLRIALDGASAMVEMKMGQKNISDFIGMKTGRLNALVQFTLSMKVVVTKKQIALLLTDSRVNQNETVTLFNEHAAHGPGAQIAIVGWIGFAPNDFGDNTKHGATIELEKTGIYWVNLHRFRLGKGS
jgi:hypothetical protein